MERLPAGTRLDGGRLEIPGGSGDAIVLSDPAGEGPHGLLYRGTQGSASLLVTILDPRLVSACADPLFSDVARAGSIEHKNLLPQFGIGQSEGLHYLVQGWPGGGTARTFLQKRIEQGKPIDLKAAFTLTGHVCAALSALHRVTIHGYVTADTVYVTNRGRILLSASGLGGCLPQAPGFARFRALGRLPNLAPEQLLPVPQLVPGTDVFGTASLLIELLCGRPLPAAGFELRELGLDSSSDLVECLQRATAPDPNARPPDTATFKAELAQALGLRPVVGRQRTLPPTPRPPPPVPSHFQPPAPGVSSARHETIQLTGPPPPLPGGLSGRVASPTTAESGLLDLGLDLEHLELASHRLSTIDGHDDSAPPPSAVGQDSRADSVLQAFGISAADPRYLVDDGSAPLTIGSTAQPMPTPPPAPTPSRSPTRYGSPAPPNRAVVRPSPPPAPPSATATAERYVLVRAGVDHGPYSVPELEDLIRSGNIRSVDTLHPAGDPTPVMVVDVPGLRQVCEAQVADEERKRKAAAAPAPPLRGPARSNLATLVIVVAVLAAFAVAGWVLWQRAGGAV